MIRRCGDGSYVVLASRVEEGRARAYALRIWPDRTAAALELGRASRGRRLGGASVAAALASGAAAAALTFAGLRSLPASVGAVVLVEAAVAAFRLRAGGPLAWACRGDPARQPVEGVAYLGRRSFAGRQLEVVSVRVGGSEYYVALTSGELGALRWLVP